MFTLQLQNAKLNVIIIEFYRDIAMSIIAAKQHYPTYQQLVGSTPIVALTKLCKDPNLQLLAKLEYFNPTLSIKDRMVNFILQKAIDEGAITSNSTIVEASSGNTASSVAMYANAYGCKAIIVMPDSTSLEKIKLTKIYGATVILAPSSAAVDSPDYYANKAKQIVATTPNAFTLDQYNNKANLNAHYCTTAQEIWEQTQGNIDCIVGCASTGGTMSGIAKFFKEKQSKTKIVIADPLGSIYKPYFDTGDKAAVPSGKTKLEGAGKKYITGCIDFKYIDAVETVTDEQAFSMQQQLARTEGIFAGGTGAASMYLALQIILNNPQPQSVLTIIPDTGLKYLSKL